MFVIIICSKKLVSCLQILRNKKQLIVKHLRQDIAQLLKNSRCDAAFSRVEQLFADQYELLDNYGEFVTVHLPYIRTHRKCPGDIKEAISTLLFAAAYLGDLPELKMIQKLLTERYGRKFVKAAAELGPGSLVNHEAKITKVQNQDYSYCVYDSDISSGLEAGSFLFLLVSQLLIMLASRCMCCEKAQRPGGSRAYAVVLFITCWCAFLLVLCEMHTIPNTGTTYISHLELRKGVFGAEAAYIVFTGIVSELYYVSYSKANDQLLQGKDTGVRMGSL